MSLAAKSEEKRMFSQASHQWAKKNLAVLMDDRMKEAFLRGNVWSFSRAAKQSRHNHKVTVCPRWP